MIPRYAPADMAALFSDTARFSLWLEVELLATEAQAALGVVPAEDAAACRAKAPTVDEVFVTDVLDARRSRTTMWRPSSMWCRSASARRPARTSITG